MQKYSWQPSSRHNASRLKAAREAAGLSLGQVYDATGIDTNRLKALEKGTAEISSGNLQKLADLYGVTGTYLMEK